MENISAKSKVVTSSKPNKMKQKFVPRDYKGLSKDDLRQELRKRGIKVSGKKADLVCITHFFEAIFFFTFSVLLNPVCDYAAWTYICNFVFYVHIL